MVMFLALHPIESISLNSLVLLEHLAMLLTLTLAITPVGRTSDAMTVLAIDEMVGG